MAQNLKVIYGFDILKFLMAISIVALHTGDAFRGYSWGGIVIPIIDISVPIFFVLSSFFLFKKMRPKFEWGGVIPFCKRIAIMYGFWFCVNIPFIIAEKDYLIVGNVWEGVVQFLKDVLFSSTFIGSWFLSALLVSVLFVYFLKRIKCTDVAVLIFGICWYVYFELNNFLPSNINGLYIWMQHNIRNDLSVTFVRGIPWVIVGYLLTSNWMLVRLEKWKDSKPLVPFFMLFIMYWVLGMINDNLIINTINRVLGVVFILWLFYMIEIPQNTWCRVLRNLSILLYMLHMDVFLFLKFIIPQMNSIGLFTFAISFMVSLLIAGGILLLSDVKGFKWLKYAY